MNTSLCDYHACDINCYIVLYTSNWWKLVFVQQTEVLIVTSSLCGDINKSKIDSFRSNAIRVLAKIVDVCLCRRAFYPLLWVLFLKPVSLRCISLFCIAGVHVDSSGTIFQAGYCRS